MMNRGLSEGPYWTPPAEYLEALRDRVYPIYAELLEDPFVRRAPYGWSDERMRGRGIPPDWGPWEMGLEPLATDLNFLFFDLESLLQRHTMKENQVEAKWLEIFGRQRPEKEKVPSSLGIQIRLRDALLEVLEEIHPEEAPEAPPLRMLLDGTVRTLYMWMIWPERQHPWRFPLHQWPDPNDTRLKDAPDRSLRERMEIASAPREGRKKDVKHREMRRNWIEGAEGMEPEEPLFIAELRNFPNSESLPETVRAPDTLERVLWAVVILSEYGRSKGTRQDRGGRKGRKECRPSEQTRKDREELRAIGERLLGGYGFHRDRWRRERVLSDWLHELRKVENIIKTAEGVLEEVGLHIAGAGRDLDTKIPQPSGQAGSPKAFFGQLVVRVYEYYRGEKADRDPRRPRDGKLPPRRSPDLDALEQTASALEWLLPQPEKWIVRTSKGKLSSKGKLYRTVNRECYGGS